MPKPINIEWRSYDTNELTVTYAEHVGPIFKDAVRSPTCMACWCDQRHAVKCSIDITAAYRNLTRNLAAVVMAAAVAQEARELARPAVDDAHYEHRNEMYR